MTQRVKTAKLDTAIGGGRFPSPLGSQSWVHAAATTASLTSSASSRALTMKTLPRGSRSEIDGWRRILEPTRSGGWATQIRRGRP
jgi:hypothetical protein